MATRRITLQSIDADAANALATRHQVEAFVDLLKLELVRDLLVDIDLVVHVPVDELRHVGAAACTAESGALPATAGDELDRTRRDFLAGFGNADDGGDTPAFVAALQGLTHQRDIADALEAVVGAALGQLDQVRDQITFDFLWIDEVRHAELALE